MNSRTALRDTALIAVFAAFVAALSIAPAVPIGPVPITLQTLAVGLTGAILGWWRGGLAVLLYLVVGLANLPVFAQGYAGIGIITQPSAGYLFSFPIAALLIGAGCQWLLRRSKRLLPAKFIGVILAVTVLVIHPAGIVGMSLNLHLSLAQAFVFDLPFLPGDILKAAIAGGIAAVVHRSFPALLDRRTLVLPPAPAEAQ